MLSLNTSSAPIRLLSKQMFLTTSVWEVAVVQVVVWVEAWAKGWEEGEVEVWVVEPACSLI